MKRFITVFVSGLLAFGLANVVSYFVRCSPKLMDGFRCFGFPFLVWSEGGIAGTSEFSRAALWNNIYAAPLRGCCRAFRSGVAGDLCIARAPQRRSPAGHAEAPRRWTAVAELGRQAA